MNQPSTSPGRKDWLEPWHVNPSLNKDYDVIDGLRGLAILMVVACHHFYANPTAGLATRFAWYFIMGGGWGVTIFFTLSGFLISYPFWKKKLQGAPRTMPPGYAGRRFWKVYPPLALSILLFTPIYFWLSQDASYFTLAGQWLLGWPIVLPPSSRINPVMWSLIIEVQFYLLLPLLFLCLKRVPIRRAVILLFLVFLVVPTGIRWWEASRGIFTALHPVIQTRFPVQLDAFALGILLAGLEVQKLLSKSWARLGDLGLVLLFVTLGAHAWLGLFRPGQAEWNHEIIGWGVKISAGLLLCYIADPMHPRTRLLSQRWLRWCGIISYEWYLFHQPIYAWVRAAVGSTSGHLLSYLALTLGTLLVGLILAAVVYRYFSLPILKFGRGRHQPR